MAREYQQSQRWALRVASQLSITRRIFKQWRNLDSEELRKRLLGPAMNMSIRVRIYTLSGTVNVKGDAYQSGSTSVGAQSRQRWVGWKSRAVGRARGGCCGAVCYVDVNVLVCRRTRE
jgi:hypothetical protein